MIHYLRLFSSYVKLGCVLCVLATGATSAFSQDLLPTGAWLTPPGHACIEQYRLLDEPVGDRCLIVPDGQDQEAASQTRTTLLETPSGPREITYMVIDDLAITEGDIILGEAALFDDQGPLGAGIYEEGAGLERGWGDCTVPYTIDPNLTNPQRVTNAIAHWESLTCFQFVPRTTETDYVTFRRGSGCSSSVGRRGGRQYVNLANGCSTGAAIHEIGHAVGLWHEQNRADRDDFVIINYENIRSGYASQFNQYRTGADHGEYDFRSVMHYGSYAFSANGLPTIVRLDGSTFSAQRSGLSETDQLAVAAMYRAP